MKKIISLILIVVMMLGLVSCFEPIDPQQTTTTNGNGGASSTTTTTTKGNGGGNSNTTTNTTKKPSGTSGTTGTTITTGTTTTTTWGTPAVDDPSYDSSVNMDQMDDFNMLFDPNNHISFELDISDKELAKLQRDYENYSAKGSKSPIYRMANLKVTITTPDGNEHYYEFEQVGVRMKGNTSRTSFYNNHDGMYNLVHFKISFQETFDDAQYYGADALKWTDEAARKERKNRTFATLEKIDIRWNRNDDPTYIRETYAYELYREQGVLAPHTNLASVDIGKDHAGVWLIYEPIDKIFLEKNLPAEALGGDLYKLGWTSEGATFTSFRSYGVEDEDAVKFYVYDLKTNKKTSDHSSLRNFISTINSSSANRSSIEKVLDVDNFLRYAAVSYIVGNPDDLRNNYNNTYIYFRADTGQMLLIPYDMDRGLGVNSWNPYGNGMTTDSPFQSYNVGGDQRSPLFTKTIHNNGLYKNEYIEAIKTVVASHMLSNDKFEESFNIAKNLYQNETRPSKTYHNAGNYSFRFDINKSCGAGDSSCMSFRDYISAKFNTIRKYIDFDDKDYTDNNNNNNNNNQNQNQNIEWELYLRGNFDDNNWENHEKYKLKHIGNGVYSVTVTATRSNGDAGTFKFKIYNNKQSGDMAWYNMVDESKTAVSFKYQGGNRNIQLALGTYTIYFDTNTQTIYIEQK